MRALVVLMLFAGLRIGETVPLDIDDVTIRSGKGDAREVRYVGGGQQRVHTLSRVRRLR